MPTIGKSGCSSGEGEEREVRGRVLGLRRPGTSFFHFKNCFLVYSTMESCGNWTGHVRRGKSSLRTAAERNKASGN